MLQKSKVLTSLHNLSLKVSWKYLRLLFNFALNTLLNGCKAVIPKWALLLQLLLSSASLFCTTERVTK